MARFTLQLVGCPSSLLIDTDATTIRELGEQLIRQRFIAGALIKEGDHVVEPPTDLMAPLHRVLLMTADA